MAWAIVAGGLISAAGSVYQGKAIAAANEFKKRGIDLHTKQAEIDALAALNDHKDELAQINSSILNQTAAMGTDRSVSASVSAILNKNESNILREDKLTKLNILTVQTTNSMEKAMLDFNSKTAKKASYINAAGTILSSWGTASMLGKANPASPVPPGGPLPS